MEFWQRKCVVNIQVSNMPKRSSLYRNRMLGFFIVRFPSDAKINQSIKIYICLFIVSGSVLKIWFLLPVKFCWQRTMQRTFLQAITIACGKATTIYIEYIYIYRNMYVCGMYIERVCVCLCACVFNLHRTSRHTTSMDAFVCSWCVCLV